MSCEPAWHAYAESLASLIRITEELRTYANRLGGQLGSRPSLLLGGDVNSWRRFASEAETEARTQRHALERYVEQAVQHQDVSTP